MGSRSVWSDEKTKALIAVWGDAKIQAELDGAVRNKAVYEKTILCLDTILRNCSERSHGMCACSIDIIGQKVV